MDTYQIIAQSIGIVAMIFNVLSYQRKKYSGVIGMQLCGGILFSANFFMLGAVTGGFMNVLAVMRAIVFLKRDTFHTEKLAWQFGFGAAFILLYVLSFTAFGVPATTFNLIMEFVPVAAMIFSTYIMRMNDAKILRKYGLFVSTPWLVYNIAHVAIGAIICECLNLCSIVIGILRLDRKKD